MPKRYVYISSPCEAEHRRNQATKVLRCGVATVALCLAAFFGSTLGAVISPRKEKPAASVVVTTAYAVPAETFKSPRKAQISNSKTVQRAIRYLDDIETTRVMPQRDASERAYSVRDFIVDRVEVFNQSDPRTAITQTELLAFFRYAIYAEKNKLRIAGYGVDVPPDELAEVKPPAKPELIRQKLQEFIEDEWE